MAELKPFLQLDLNRVRENARRFLGMVKTCFTHHETKVFFAVKSLPEARVISTLQQEGLGFEVMTTTQAQLVKSLNSSWIVSGFHKPQDLLAVSQGAEYLVVEGPHEIQRLIAGGESCQVSLRIQLAGQGKIGFSLAELLSVAQSLKASTQIKLVGLHFHLGWNVKDIEAIYQATKQVLVAHENLLMIGVKILVINLGGSFCEHQSDSTQLERRLQIYSAGLSHLPVSFHFEPGRYMVGDAGTLFCEIVYVDTEKNHLHVNTCAYAYKLNAASPSVRLMEADCTTLKRWVVSGFWSAEGDACELELQGQPRAGQVLAFENMGAYVWDFAYQFEPDKGVEIRYI